MQAVAYKAPASTTILQCNGLGADFLGQVASLKGTSSVACSPTWGSSLKGVSESSTACAIFPLYGSFPKVLYVACLLHEAYFTSGGDRRQRWWAKEVSEGVACELRVRSVDQLVWFIVFKSARVRKALWIGPNLVIDG